jgi:hypothetical protein
LVAVFFFAAFFLAMESSVEKTGTASRLPDCRKPAGEL